MLPLERSGGVPNTYRETQPHPGSKDSQLATAGGQTDPAIGSHTGPCNYFPGMISTRKKRC
jgi:hypothetical protein